ncbi:S-methyl-5-thioribose kinase [uncultured Psychrobacillus sp.]|uniref:S-methyl-5-thioribose kinase n=1 Tax=uncultured Psychrobacillus sp. TaxID=1551585 RepID=UPI00261D92D6|nr:S-methyl-5-thioribose kinase [uncultured Psychrobacillus sp.]
MEKFSTYFLMDLADVKEYATKRLDFLKDSENLEVTEIGDGNLNYVFRVKDSVSGKSVIIKQAGPTARISEDIILSTDRNRIETKALEIQNQYTPGLVPHIYFSDEVMSACAMEDLGNFKIMRQSLMEHEIFPLFPEHITTFMVESLLRTSDIMMNHKGKKALQGLFINPELCEISEELVFTEPYYNNNNRNEIIEENTEFVQEHLYDNLELHREVAKLKYLFLTKTESLLHGDLHTGSVFITPTETKVIDPEFAFYGPMGYDVGNVIANLTFAWVNGVMTEDERFTNWVEQSIEDTLDLFKQKFVKLWKESAEEPFAKNESTIVEDYLSQVLKDTAGMAGLELNRRIVGLAKVKDITSLASEQRVIAERLCMLTANEFILNQSAYQSGAKYIDTLKAVKESLICQKS